MSDQPPLPHRDDGPLSATAIISYLLVSTFWQLAAAVIFLIWKQVHVDAVMLTILGSIVTAAVGALGVVGGFWLASSIQASRDSAALRQLSGSGAPPPADPSTPGPGNITP